MQLQSFVVAMEHLDNERHPTKCTVQASDRAGTVAPIDRPWTRKVVCEVVPTDIQCRFLQRVAHDTIDASQMAERSNIDSDELILDITTHLQTVWRSVNGVR